MPKTVDGDQGQVILRFPKVVQRMREPDAVRDKEVDIFCKEMFTLKI